MKRLLKKIAVSLLLAIYLLVSSLSLFPLGAQAAWYNPTPNEWYSKVFDANENEIFGERYTAAQVWWIIYSLQAFLINFFVGDDMVGCWFDPNISDCVQGVLELSPFISSTTTPDKASLVDRFLEERPISMITYVKDIGKGLKIVPEAHAQEGFGFGALEPILDLWKVTRNIAYSLMVIVIIAISFMIMFRVKISPQVVITVQSALPKIAIGLVLITFSYAIAGLLVDLMYVVIGLISVALSASGLFAQSRDSVVFFDLLTKGPAIGGVHFGLFGFLFRYYISFAATALSIAFFADSPFIKAGMVLFALLMLTVGIIVLTFIGLKVTWVLFKTLAQVLLQTVAAPFQILLGVLVPQMGFGSWLRSYISNLAVFPVISLFFVLASYFLRLALETLGDQFLAAPVRELLGALILGPELQRLLGVDPGGGTWPLMGTGSASIPLVFLGTSFVIITTIPKTVELIQSIIKGQPFDYGTAIGEAVNPMGLTGYAAAERAGVYGDILRRKVGVDTLQGKGIAAITEAFQKWAAGGFKSRG